MRVLSIVCSTSSTYTRLHGAADEIGEFGGERLWLTPATLLGSVSCRRGWLDAELPFHQVLLFIRRPGVWGRLFYCSFRPYHQADAAHPTAHTGNIQGVIRYAVTPAPVIASTCVIPAPSDAPLENRHRVCSRPSRSDASWPTASAASPAGTPARSERGALTKRMTIRNATSLAARIRQPSSGISL